MTITKTQALEARKLLRHYEAQKKAEIRAKRCALPCSALVHAYLKGKNDGYGYDALDADAQKLYRAVKSAESAALRRRRKGIVEAGEMTKIRRIRWTPQMKNALQDNDLAYLKACGLTYSAINAMRWRITHEARKEDA